MRETGSSEHVPGTYESCAQVEGPFFHGTRSTTLADTAA